MKLSIGASGPDFCARPGNSLFHNRLILVGDAERGMLEYRQVNCNVSIFVAPVVETA
jgi:hypothetical protein